MLAVVGSQRGVQPLGLPSGVGIPLRHPRIVEPVARGGLLLSSKLVFVQFLALVLTSDSTPGRLVLVLHGS